MAAHPDDDVMGAAGYVALNRDDPGLRFVLIHATDGDAGEIAPGIRATRETLGSVRRREDESGWRSVGRMPIVMSGSVSLTAGLATSLSDNSSR